MSKYGSCNINKGKKVNVGCLDGFQCIENQCREPNSNTQTITSVPYQFEISCKDGCRFSEKVKLKLVQKKRMRV